MTSKTIQELEARKRLLLLRLRRIANELIKIDNDLRKMRTGKKKVAPPKGVKININTSNPGLTADEFGDVIPSFGPE